MGLFRRKDATGGGNRRLRLGRLAGSHGMRHGMTLFVILALLWPMLPGCSVEQPFSLFFSYFPTAAEYDRGLVVLYPGGSSAPPEMAAWPPALRLGGVDDAMQIVNWGILGDSLFNATAYERHKEWAQAEAQRLAQFMQEHPDSRVTLIGYSAGAGIAAFVAERMPLEYPVDRVLLISADLYRGYDVVPMLDRTRRGAVHYWSPLDQTADTLTALIGTMDRSWDRPAFADGFDSQDPRLVQLTWAPEMALYGNYGGHLDVLFNIPWISRYMAPLILDGRDDDSQPAAQP